MQPNTTQFQPAPGMTPVQPAQTPAIPVQNPTPVPPAPRPQSKSHTSLILAILFGIIALGLVAFIIVDKLVLSKPTVTIETGALSAPLSTRLSDIEVPAGSAEDILKNVLAGRTFAVNSSFEEFITFTTDSKYVFSYYRNPIADRINLTPSTEGGTYTVKDQTISLQNGESFKITGDYLVKTSQKKSANNTAVYFDAQQFSTIMPNLTTALSSYLDSNRKTGTANFEKIRIDRLYCHADYSVKNMTNADSYLCDTTYTYQFDRSNVAKQMQAAKINNFPAYCAAQKSPYAFYANEGICNYDYNATSWNYIIVRTDNIKYHVTGVFRTASDNQPLARF